MLAEAIPIPSHWGAVVLGSVTLHAQKVGTPGVGIPDAQIYSKARASHLVHNLVTVRSEYVSDGTFKGGIGVSERLCFLW